MKCVIIACLVLQFIIYIFKFKKCYKWSKAIILSLYTNWVIPFVIRTAPPPPPPPLWMSSGQNFTCMNRKT